VCAPMLPIVDVLVQGLGLAPHPEGGFFRETFRSAKRVSPADGRGPRAALTTIDFLLASGQTSRLHRVRSDEVWHFSEGAPLELVVWEPDSNRLDRWRLGPRGAGGAPTHVVPAGSWQAARTTGDYTLVGCTVGPGFDFADFIMMAAHDALIADCQTRRPELTEFI
jgi:uncharacterized protein